MFESAQDFNMEEQAQAASSDPRDLLTPYDWENKENYHIVRGSYEYNLIQLKLKEIEEIEKKEKAKEDAAAAAGAVVKEEGNGEDDEQIENVLLKQLEQETAAKDDTNLWKQIGDEKKDEGETVIVNFGASRAAAAEDEDSSSEAAQCIPTRVNDGKLEKPSA